jgi:hypothetical protein
VDGEKIGARAASRTGLSSSLVPLAHCENRWWLLSKSRKIVLSSLHQQEVAESSKRLALTQRSPLSFHVLVL